MRAAVVPLQAAHRHATAHERFEDALGVGDIDVVVAVGDCRGLVSGGEEARRRQLLRIADDHQLRAAHDRADGVLGRQLRRLVEHHEVERRRRTRRELRHRQRAHEEDGLDRAHGGVGALQRLADRPMVALLGHLAAQHGHGGLHQVLAQPCLHARPKRGDEPRPVVVEHAPVEVAELPHPLLVRERLESRECRPRLDARRQPGEPERPQERVSEGGVGSSCPRLPGRRAGRRSSRAPRPAAATKAPQRAARADSATRAATRTSSCSSGRLTSDGRSARQCSSVANRSTASRQVPRELLEAIGGRHVGVPRRPPSRGPRGQ